MFATLGISLALALCAGPDGTQRREPSPYAPSLPRLSDEDERKLDKIIERFLQQDIGLLKGKDAERAVKDFAALKAEAIPALIRGLNRAAKIEHSCPCLLIAKKLERLLLASDDRELLEFARDEIGCDVGKTRHQPVLQDLRLRATFRMNEMARKAPAGPKAPRLQTVAELADAASSERGPRLKMVLLELEKRDGPEVLSGLGLAAGSYDSDIARIGRDGLDRYLSRHDEAYVRARLKDESIEVRKSAIRVAAAKLPALGRDLVSLLADASADVRMAARDALVKIARGEDFGPGSADASAAARGDARARWLEWFDRTGR
jgi:hypothetical protein